MGNIVTRKNDNDTLDFEITYGGKESPFGGVDASAPPPYIDPRGFVDSNGFFIFHGQLKAMGWVSTGVTLGGWTGLMIFLGGGTFFARGKYWNWALADTPTSNPGPPPNLQVVYYIWVWQANVTGTVPLTASFNLVQYQQVIGATSAVAHVTVSNGYFIPAGDPPVDVEITVGTSTVTVTYNDTMGPMPHNPRQLATALDTAINSAVGFPCTSVLDASALTLILTTTATGASANTTNLAVDFIGPLGGVSISQNFQGGADGVSTSGVPISTFSWTAVGETLYISGNGSVILKFSFAQDGSAQFGVLTQYLGAVTLAKFSGQLIAGGIVPGPSLTIDSPEMVIAWSAPEGAYGIWEALNPDGTVTGAGFNQIADISDYISGMFVSNGILVLLRAQGVDYMTVLQNATIPFDFNHISNTLQGEGCQDTRLAGQYDQIGIFIGNSDIYEWSNTLVPVGHNIKNKLLPNSREAYVSRDILVGSFPFEDDSDVYAIFVINYNIYVYHFNNKTWMILKNMNLEAMDNKFFLMSWSNIASDDSQSQFINYYSAILSTQRRPQGLPYNIPNFWTLTSGVQNIDFPYSLAPSYILFPQERISFGRDITIDALLVSLQGSPGQVIQFSVSGILHSTFTIPDGTDPTVASTYQVFFDEGATTVQDPQLRIDVPYGGTGVVNPLSFVTLAMYGSFDPNQRPV